jgi:hypothetical protein
MAKSERWRVPRQRSWARQTAPKSYAIRVLDDVNIAAWIDFYHQRSVRGESNVPRLKANPG